MLKTASLFFVLISFFMIGCDSGTKKIVPKDTGANTDSDELFTEEDGISSDETADESMEDGTGKDGDATGDGDMIGKDDHGLKDDTSALDDDTVSPDEDIVPPTCGNGDVDSGEVCDENLIDCIDIDDKLYSGGKATCQDTCLGWDTITCDEIPHTCGNGIVEGPEICDTQLLTNCVEIDPMKYSAGKAYCLEDCSGYDTATCEEIVADDDADDEPDTTDIPFDADMTDDVQPDISDIQPDLDMSDTDVQPDMQADVDIVDTDIQPDVDIVCSHDCDTLTETYCNGAIVMQCQIGIDGCRHWTEELDCADTGRSCEDNNEVGDNTESNARSALTKVNHFQCTATHDLKSFEMYIAPSLIGQSLVWVLYEATTETGNYTLIAQKTTSATGTTAAWYSSGAMTRTDAGHVGETITLTSGRYYAIGLAWNENLTSYYWAPSFLGSFETEYTLFGATLGGTANDATYPPLASFSGGPANDSTYWMRVHVLNTDVDLCVCQNECDTVGIQQCNVNAVEECSADLLGCLYWHFTEDCVVDYTPDRVCTESLDTATCEEEVTEVVDTVGSAGTLYSGDSRMRGNFYSCTTNRTLTEIEMYLDYSGTAAVYFEVYESSALGDDLSPYEPVYTASKTLTMSSGGAFYSSGTISVPLYAGNYYYIGVRWGSSYTISYYNASLSSKTTAFGAWSAGMTNDDVLSAPSSIFYSDTSASGYAYYQRLTTTE
ncbi:MAG TPA: hypothetical protein PLV42_11990 [bacterium]|nr:hypothetical protein [bacterium]